MFLSIISPSKKLNSSSLVPNNVCAQASTPKYTENAWELAQIMKKFTAEELEALLKISNNLATLNYKRYQRFAQIPNKKGSLIPAMYAFKGDTFLGLELDTLEDDLQNRANKYIRILSGLYGLLAPFDNIQAHRLEMGTKFPALHELANLYDYWSDQLTKDLDLYIQENNITALINLASIEYSSVINKSKLSVETITPSFMNLVNGSLKPCGMYIKRYRGMMARYIIDNQIDNLEDLKKFNYGGLLLYNADNLLFVKPK